ncbi:hypothetical protein ACJMK2_044558 [Sinanodonta woodiana]|uniref:Uncharacterized protein n=1 Tax=Sinanodonta woodiana TaxID=1069815 RepID=A0ABD3W0E5_SINWO
MEIDTYVKQYVESVEKKESKDPGTKSFSTVREWSNDKFARAKLAFIVSVAKPVENVLKVYQTDKPMIHFLAKDLEDLMRTTMEGFVRVKWRQLPHQTNYVMLMLQTKTTTKGISMLI